MPSSAVYSNHFKYSLSTKGINLSSDTIKVLLMRSGFTFNKKTHATKKNIKGTITGSSNIVWSASAKTATLAAGGYVDAGFVIGNQLLVSGTSSNNGTFTVTGVSDTVLTFTETVTDEADTSAVISCTDELETGFGYTQDNKTVSLTVEENDTSDECIITIPTISWTASGGSIGPTPGAILYSDTSTDDTIIAYFEFNSEVTAQDTVVLSLINGEMSL